MNKKITSFVLAVCMLLSCIAVGSFSAAATTADDSVSASEDESVGASYGLMKTPQEGVILHAWQWSFNNIKANMKKIAEAGYTSVQTSVIQQAKEGTKGKTNEVWWVYYQPANFTIDNTGNSALGTKAEFASMCEEAHKYGIHVIVDVVANHLGNNRGYDKASIIPSDIRDDNNCWHDLWNKEINYGDRYSITHGSMGGLPDLNSENSKIQNYVKAYLRECIDCGADGFRFDAAKHISVPEEGSQYNFWPNVLNDASSYYAQKGTYGTLYNYGEILDGTGGPSVGGYTQYMSVTDNRTGNDKRNAVGNASAMASSNYKLGAAPNKTVLWAESHDTYSNDSKESTGVSDSNINKVWAMVGSRNQATALYFARTQGYRGGQIGNIYNTNCFNKEVVAVNKLHNAFNGQSEYLSSSGSIAYNERGTAGAVLVNCSGGSTSVNVKANKMKDGTYTDQVSGGTFRVSGGQISGQIGNTGIAVIFNDVPAGPYATVTPGSTRYKTDTLTLTLKYENATSGQYSIDGGSFQNFTNGQTITIGQNAAVGTATTVTVKASNGSTTSDPETYTYTKADNTAQGVYFDNSSYNWSSVYAYIYIEGGSNNPKWPGTKMTKDSSTGYYYLEVPEGFEDATVIFTESETATTNRYPADMQPGLPLEGTTKIFKANHQFVEYNPPVPTQPSTTKPQPTTAPITNKILLGDTTGDKKVTVTDATVVQLHVAGQTTLTGDKLKAGDVDKDGSVTITDATLIQLYLVQKKSSTNYTGTWIGGTEPVTQPQPTTAKPTTPVPTTVKPTTPPSTGVTLNASATSTGTEDWYAWTWDSSSDGRWIKGSGSAASVSFSGNIGKNIIFVRLPKGETPASNWGNVWNQTNDLTTKMGGTFKTTGWNNNIMNGNWL